MKSQTITRRQAIHATGKILAGAAGLAALTVVSGSVLEAQTQQDNGLSQREQIPDTGEKLRIATCQFPVSSNAAENAKYIRDFMHQASEQGAHLLHTSETSLSGYGGSDIDGWSKFDWDALRRETESLRTLAVDLKLYLALGSTHFLDADTKPMNCLYLISPEGKILDRYDKCFLTKRDQLFYSAGNRLVTREIRGVKLGLAICYDICWPQLYIAYRELGAKVMLHSMYNAKDKGPNHLDTLNVRAVPTRCSDNRMWAVCNNSSEPYSHWGSFIARPDTSIPKQLAMNEPGMLVHDFPDAQLGGEWYFNLQPMRNREDELMSWGITTNNPRRRNGQSEP